MLALGLRRVSEGGGERFSCWILRDDRQRFAPAFGSYDEIQMREELAIGTNSHATKEIWWHESARVQNKVTGIQLLSFEEFSSLTEYAIYLFILGGD